jgi:hypothetical protein
MVEYPAAPQINNVLWLIRGTQMYKVPHELMIVTRVAWPRFEFYTFLTLTRFADFLPK